MATTSRMLVLLTLLQARRDWPGRALAERLDISERTVRRDVDRLRELGYRVRAIKGPDGGYRLDAGSELPPLLFDDDQALALAIALQAMVGTGLDEAAARALATVRQVMPARLRHRLDAVRLTAIAPDAPAPVSPEMLVALGTSIRESHIVRFDYADAPRRVEPHHLVMRAGRWYLVAWDLDRADWRTFRVDRMTLRTHAGAKFSRREVPGGDAAAFVSARFKGSSELDEWPCRGEVVIALPLASVIPWVADSVAEAVDDDRTRVVLGSWSWVGLAARLGQFGAELEVVRPPELRDAFRELGARYFAA